jgi:hypothetical protein
MIGKDLSGASKQGSQSIKPTIAMTVTTSFSRDRWHLSAAKRMTPIRPTTLATGRHGASMRSLDNSSHKPVFKRIIWSSSIPPPLVSTRLRGPAYGESDLFPTFHHYATDVSDCNSGLPYVAAASPARHRARHSSQPRGTCMVIGTKRRIVGPVHVYRDKNIAVARIELSIRVRAAASRPLASR